MYLYSKSANGFFHEDIHGPRGEGSRIPSDAVEITDDEHRALLRAQSAGKRIVAGPDGRPIAADQAPPSDEQLMAELRARRDRLLALTDGHIARHRDEVEAGGKTTLTDEQYVQLQAARRTLRDLPAKTKDLAQPAWPKLPAGIA
jgi:hypothetical protein